MYLNITVETPSVGNGISYKAIKGTKYVYYEHGRRYDSKRKYTVPQTTTIGKICDDDSMMYPNTNYLKFFPEAELPDELPVSVRSGCLKIGDYLVIKRVIEHYKLDEEISGISWRKLQPSDIRMRGLSLTEGISANPISVSWIRMVMSLLLW